MEVEVISQEDKDQLLSQLNLLREKIAACLAMTDQLNAYKSVHPYIAQTLDSLQTRFNKLNRLYTETEQRPVS